MPPGALTIAQYPADMVRLACTRCQRRGQYRKASLIERHGGDTSLPDLRLAVARCPHAGALGTACGVYFVDLSIARD